jgi:hypothetical protein
LGITFTKSSSGDVVDSIQQARADTTAALNDLQATRDAEVQNVINQALAADAQTQAAMNLQPTVDVVDQAVGSWAVKTKTSS